MKRVNEPRSTLIGLRRRVGSESLPMTVKQAKDFLVQQTTQQAALEGMALSDVERRMMYLAESDTSCEDPLQPSEKLKISGLLHHAFERIKTEDRDIREWNLAIHALRRGDHVLLGLWDTKPANEHFVYDFLKLLSIAILAAMGIFFAEIFR
jgi:hypothetical protein